MGKCFDWDGRASFVFIVSFGIIAELDPGKLPRYGVTMDGNLWMNITVTVMVMI